MALRRYSVICRAVPSAAFSAMLPLKPSVTITSAAPLPMPSPSTKPMIFQLRQVHRAQQLGRLAHLLEALDLLDADIEQADGRPFEIEQHASPSRCP